ncbi:MAG: hypothetical protein Q8M22_20740 [Actinomycetota bacterium]|nr:hypothetical protein [Actinomycetota bacterium]
MPSRRRPKSPRQPVAPAPAASSGPRAPQRSSVDADLERFAAALKESEQLDRAAKQRSQQAKADAARAADEAAAKAASLATARRDLERAVEAVRQAKQLGKGRAAADDAWKVAKATVIELETGVAPAWAAKAPAEQPVEEIQPDE